MTGPAANPLAAALRQVGLGRPGAPALSTPDGRHWTHGELDDWSALLARDLVRRGAGPGERVVVRLPKSPEALTLSLACARAGVVLVPIDVALPDAQVAALVVEADPAVVIDDLAAVPAPPSSAAPVFDDVPRGLDDPAAILFTSGTTGRPKGALLSQGNLVANLGHLVDAWQLAPDDTLLHVLPLTHTHGLFVAAEPVLAAGGLVVLHPRFDPAAAVAALPGATVLMGVPTHHVRLLAEPGFADAARGLRLLTSGSAPLPVAVFEGLARASGRPPVERYGMTETSILTSNPYDGERRPGSVGLPLAQVRLRVAAPGPDGVGAVEVGGPTVLGEYWRRPELRAEAWTPDGWFRTGDLGRLDPDGYLHLAGRAKDLVISGGLNVYPADVEAVLDAVPGVREAAVIGLPDPDLGERVVAVVVTDPAGPPVTPAALRAAVRERLAGYQVPRDVVLRDALPRTVLGKVEKARLRDELT